MPITVAQMKALGPKEEIFEHIDKDTGAYTVFASGLLFKFVVQQWADGKLDGIGVMKCESSFDDWYMREHVTPRCNIERLVELTQDDLEYPIVGCTWADGTTTIVDGNHRLTRLWLDGEKTFKWFNVPEKVWREFTVQGARPRTEEQIMATDRHARGR